MRTAFVLVFVALLPSSSFALTRSNASQAWRSMNPDYKRALRASLGSLAAHSDPKNQNADTKTAQRLRERAIRQIFKIADHHRDQYSRYVDALPDSFLRMNSYGSDYLELRRDLENLSTLKDRTDDRALSQIHQFAKKYKATVEIAESDALNSRRKN